MLTFDKEKYVIRLDAFRVAAGLSSFSLHFSQTYYNLNLNAITLVF
jgi:hypothetical protein